MEYTNVLLIDRTVQDYEIFVDSVNSNTLAIVYPSVFTIPASVKRIGVVFIKKRLDTFFTETLVDLLGTIEQVDFLACEALLDPMWKVYFESLPCKVGASNNLTGNLQQGGDWVMESTCEDIEKVYFTDNIHHYNYLLDTYTVDEVYPLTGPPRTRVFMRGQNLAKANRVQVGALDASYTHLSDYLMLATIPDITITSTITLSGLATTNNAAYSFIPTVMTITPTSLTGNISTVLSIAGTNMSVVAVQFGATPSQIVSSTPTNVTCIVPYGYGTSFVDLYDKYGNTKRITPFTYLDGAVDYKTVSLTGMTQDSLRSLCTWTSTTVTLNDQVVWTQTGIQSVAVDTNILYVSDGTTTIKRINLETNSRLIDFTLPVGVTKMFLYSNRLYLPVGSSIYIIDVTTGKQTQYNGQTYSSLAVWNNNLYGSNGINVYKVILDNSTNAITQTLLTSVTGTITQLMTVNNRLYILATGVTQYNLLTSSIDQTLTGTYSSMAYSDIYLLLYSTKIVRYYLPPVLSTNPTLVSCTPFNGTKNTRLEVIGENLDLIDWITFDDVPATNISRTKSRLYFDVPEGTGTPDIVFMDTSKKIIPHTFIFTYRNTTLNYCTPREGGTTTPVYLFGDYLDRVKYVFMGSTKLSFDPIRSNTIRVIPGSSTGIKTFTLFDNDYNLISNTNVTYSYVNIYSNICFPAKTKVFSDQGPIDIQKLIPGINTVYGKDIVAVTETFYMDTSMVCIEKGALGPQTPTVRTLMSKKHKVFVQGRMMEAHKLVGSPGITFVPHDGSKLYNVLLNQEGRMNVQGMICETLDPSNPIASQFRPHRHNL